ncbi:hypothetical protein [Aminipila sp.]|uniref:hypothetical protein n=1 Tax=Aminipila sp. TaxID=2060095 RepID=UPI002897E3BC|nr:hypothetical protein [Aminipila sp.]
MNKKLKKALKAAFEAPCPSDMERFLKQLRYPKINYQEFIFDQLHYIRKRIWVASALIVFLGWIIAFRLPAFQCWNPDGIKIWSISAALPFLAMISVTEIYRSAAYCMSELEGSCRFSLLQIVMARISILGVVNFVVLILILIFINQVSAYSLLQIVFYSIVPYLVVCSICLRLLNRTRSSEGIYACAVTAGIVSAISILCESTAKVLYSSTYLNIWLILFVSCSVLIGIQMRKLVKQMEEKQWNLNLIE